MRLHLPSIRILLLGILTTLVASVLAGTAAQARVPAPEPAAQQALAAEQVAVLVFHGPIDEQNDAVTEATDAIRTLGQNHGFSVDEAEDPGVFTAANLARYRGVVFLSAYGVSLSSGQEAALKGFLNAGGGFLGVHDAARAQADSAWFTGLIGTRPANSPVTVQRAVVDITDRQHPANKGLPLNWTRSDQWLNWSPNPLGTVHVVAQVEEWTYQAGLARNGPFHPVSWCRDYDGGRSFYTGMGYTPESYADPKFRGHLLGAIQWTTGMVRAECQATIASNYSIERLTAENQPGKLDQIGEPHGLAIAPAAAPGHGKVFYVGKAACPTGPIEDWADPNVGLGCGTIHQWDPRTKRVKLLTTLQVMGNRGFGSELVKNEEGLVGIVLDPKFLTNGWIYAYWMPHDTIDRDRRIGQRTVSRFTYNHSTESINQNTRKDLLSWNTQIHSCCHAGGGMAFDKLGNLYIGSGDSNSSGGSGGYSGNNWTQAYKGISFQDARRTSGNTNDLNGKIIRIKPQPDGTYTIPPGNLFTGAEEGGGKTRPEIYVMGVRNIARLSIDAVNNYLYAGWVGPDAGEPSPTWGPAKYETATVITSAGNQGWPYCMGNRQPYRDRSNTDASQPAGWYDCNNLKNTSPRNTGLVNIPPARDNAIWYAPNCGGPVFPPQIDGSGIPSYIADEATCTQPYLKGGGQAIMSGPTYHRALVDPNSTVAWPAYWENKWFIGDESNRENRVAVTMDPTRLASQGPPAFAEDIRSIIRYGEENNQLGQWMDAKFGPDGALYMLDYGRGFFSLDRRQKLIRVVYQGGPATPRPNAVTAESTGQGTPMTFAFNGARAGGIAQTWDFGDGGTSTELRPRHSYLRGGSYQVKLTVTYAGGAKASHSIPVHVGCQAPDNRQTVWLLDTNSGVANKDLGGSCTVNDLLDDERAWPSNTDFVAYLTQLTNRLKAATILTTAEADALLAAARRSGIGLGSSYRPIFDGSAASLQNWTQAPGGSFDLQSDGSIRSVGGLGMLWYKAAPFGDFSVRMQFRDSSPGTFRANSGVFVRFPDPRTPLEQRPTGSCGTLGPARTSPAWVAIYCGQEVQLYDGPAGEPQKTGSIYNFSHVGLDEAGATPKQVWNDYEVRVVGQRYTITRNGVVINRFDNTPGKQSSRAGDPPTDLRQFISGYLGLQNHGNNDVIDFRNIQVRDLSAPAAAARVSPRVASPQLLEWTASSSIEAYRTAPTTAVQGPTTIVFETSRRTDNLTGMQHTLTFDQSTPGYNHDVELNIVADPGDINQGRHERQVTLTPGKYRYFCAIPGHPTMVGEFTVTDGTGPDTTPPVTNARVDGTKDADGNYVGRASTTLTATDDNSGVASIEYALDGGAFTAYTAPVVVDAVGSHTLKYRATDNAGNVAPEKSESFTVVASPDITPPETSATVTGEKDAQGNYIARATVALAATDAGSGVASIEYSLDDGAYVAYTTPVVVETLGAHMLHYRATDRAGNVSAVKMESFTVVAAGDRTPPVVVATVLGKMRADWSFVDTATVKLVATDNDSGVDTVEYALNGAGYAAYTQPVVVTGDGRHALKHKAKDKAGNVSPEGTATFTIGA